VSLLSQQGQLWLTFAALVVILAASVASEVRGWLRERRLDREAIAAAGNGSDGGRA